MASLVLVVNATKLLVVADLLWVVDLRLHPTASAASDFNQIVEEVGLINSLAALCQTVEACIIDAARRPLAINIDNMICWYAKLLAYVAVEAFSVRVGEDMYPCCPARAIVINLHSQGIELFYRHSDSGFYVCLGHARSGGSASFTPCNLATWHVQHDCYIFTLVSIFVYIIILV
jgi:hypothetical protein